MPAARLDPGARSVPGYVTLSLRIAILAAVLAGVLSGALFIINGIFLAIRDLVVAVLAVALVPVAWAIHTRLRGDVRLPSLLAVLVGLVGLVLTVVGSADGIAANLGSGSLTGLSAMTGQGVGLGLVGVWLLLVAALGRQDARFDGRTVGAAAVGGLGFVAFGVLAVTSGFTPALPVTAAVGLLGLIAWAVWLHRRLGGSASDRMTAPLA